MECCVFPATRIRCGRTCWSRRRLVRCWKSRRNIKRHSRTRRGLSPRFARRPEHCSRPYAHTGDTLAESAGPGATSAEFALGRNEGRGLQSACFEQARHFISAAGRQHAYALRKRSPDPLRSHELWPLCRQPASQIIGAERPGLGDQLPGGVHLLPNVPE